MPSMPEGKPAGAAGGWTERAADLAELDRVARRLAGILPARALVALEGELGAGKTTFVKAVAAAAGLDPAEIVSPTFGLVHVHPLPRRNSGPERIVHADFYRLAGAVDLHEIGWEEATAGRSWVLVEWPSRAAAALWPDRLDVAIAVTGETSRTIQFNPRGRFFAVLPPA